MVYQFILFLSFFQGLLFLGHWVLYKNLIRFSIFGNPSAILALKIGLGLASIGFLVSSLLAFRFGNFLVRFLYYISAAWLGTFFYLAVSAAFLWMFFAFSGQSFEQGNLRILGIVLLCVAAAVSFYGLINARTLRVQKLEIAFSNLPPQWEGKTAVFFSDTHLGPVWQNKFSGKVVKLINDFQPAVVFMGGDFYDGGSAVNPETLAEPFSKLKSVYGTYFVTGNHDEIGDGSSHLAALRNIGFKILSDEMVDLNGLQVGGASYKNFRGDTNFSELLDKMNFNPSKPRILLKHVPSNIAEVREAGISLMLSGHTHRGQIFPLSFITKWVYGGYDVVLSFLGNTAFFTSDGVGTWGPPMRVGSGSEIAVITFRKK